MRRESAVRLASLVALASLLSLPAAGEDVLDRLTCLTQAAFRTDETSGVRYLEIAETRLAMAMTDFLPVTAGKVYRLQLLRHGPPRANIDVKVLLYDEDLLRKSAILIFPRNSEESQLKETYQWQPGEATRTILLVDDEDMIWDVLSDMLQELGYQVILAGDGKEAVEIYSGNPGMIDLVILDMLMPNMGGQETFFMLKELNPDVKVLASSGYVSQEEIQDVMDAGASGFLRKPYHMADLARKIKEIFEK